MNTITAEVTLYTPKRPLGGSITRAFPILTGRVDITLSPKVLSELFKGRLHVEDQLCEHNHYKNIWEMYDQDTNTVFLVGHIPEENTKEFVAKLIKKGWVLNPDLSESDKQPYGLI